MIKIKLTMALLCASLFAMSSKTFAQAPPLPVKSTLSQSVLTNRTFSNAASVDTIVKNWVLNNEYTLEVIAKVNSASGRGLDIEARNEQLNGYRLSLDAANLKYSTSLNSLENLSASTGSQKHTIRIAVKNDSAHIYQNGAYLLSKPLVTIKDLVAGVESDQVSNATLGTNLTSNWAGTTGNNSGKPSDYGWAYTGTTVTTLFNTANSSSGVRYIDVTASANQHTYNGGSLVGRIMYIRWDNASYQNTVYSFPVTLEANTTYDFSWLYCLTANATGPKNMTVGIGKTVNTADRLYNKVFTTNTTLKDLKKGDLYFTSQEAGVYYITITGDYALFSMAQMAVNKFTVNPRFIFGKNYPSGAVDMEIVSAKYDSGAFAPDTINATSRQTVTLTGNSVQLPTSFNTNFVVPGKTDVHFIAEFTPFANSSIALNSDNAWLFFDNIKPASVITNWLPFITINGTSAVGNTNLRIAVYKNGTVVIPNGNNTSQAALQAFTQPNLVGSSQAYAIHVFNNNLGAFNNAIRSFTLKRGYMATMATNADGSGYSRVFIANDSDLVVNTMPTGLDTTVSFIRVLKWNWPSKKGKAGWNPDKVNATWYYDWNIGGNAANNYDYSAIRQTQYWPSFTDVGNKQNINHLLGFNEPDKSDQANMTVDAAVNAWPELMKPGLRLGSPAPATPTNSWITDFLRKTDSLNYRVDFVAIHCYWGGLTPQQWYNQLKSIYDRVKRPLWITEWNNGANWTNETWPTDQTAQFQKQLSDLKGILNVLDTTSFIERYAEYDWVENKRALVLADTLTPAGKYYAANKSDFAYNPAKAFVHNWKLVATNITATINSSDYYKVNLKWTDLNGELGSKYILERKIDGVDADFVAIQTFTNYTYGSSIIYSDSVFSKASYRIKAFAADGVTFTYSLVVDVLRDNAPLAPSSLSGTVISSSRIKLDWTAGTNVRSYNVRRSLTANGPWDTIAVRTTTLTFLDTALLPATTYYYAVSTLNNAGESGLSTIISQTTPALVVPTAVLYPQVASGDSKAILTWDFQYDAKYTILRASSSNGLYDTIATNVDALRFEDTGRNNNTTYYYKIIAYNAAGSSPASNALVATPMAGRYVHIGFNEATGKRVQDDWGGYNGTLYNGISWSAGKDSSNGAVTFVKDSSSYIQLEKGVVSKLTDFTIATWFKMPANEPNNARVFDFGTSTSNYMMLCPRYLINNVANIRYKITCPTGTFQPIIPVLLPLDAWVHVVITQQGAVFKLYANGVLQYTDSNATVKPADLGITNLNYIGRSVWSSDPYCDHVYDDFSIYNYALNDAAVNNLYQGNLAALPVTLLSFTGQATANGNLLSWATTTEINNQHFVVERSIGDENAYAPIATVLAKTATTNTYSYLDVVAPTNHQCYYRLKQVDKNGTSSYSHTVLLQAKQINTGLRIYPNPVITTATIGLPSNMLAVDVQVYNANGKLVLSQVNKAVNNGTMQLNLQALAAGIYAVNIIGKNTQLTTTVVKQ